MVIHEDAQAKDMVPIIPCVLWVHGKGMTTLGYNQGAGLYQPTKP
jgi:hypothetical protein